MSTPHPSPEDYLETLRAHLRTAYGNQRWVVAMDVVQPAVRLGRALLALGATDVLAVAGSIGTGPYDASFPHVVLDVTGATMMGGIRACETAMQHLPASVVARIDAMDPECSAAVIRPLFRAEVSWLDAVAGEDAPSGGAPLKTRPSSTPSGMPAACHAPPVASCPTTRTRFSTPTPS